MSPCKTSDSSQDARVLRIVAVGGQSSSRLLTASSGACVLLKRSGSHWQAVLRHGIRPDVCKYTVPVLGSGDMDALLSGLQGRDVWASKARVHVMVSPYPPHGPCVYLGKIGLLGGAPIQQAPLVSEELWLSGLNVTLGRNEIRTEVFHIPTGHHYKGFRFKKEEVKNASCTVRYVSNDSKEKIDQLAGIHDNCLLEEKLARDFGISVPLGRLEVGDRKMNIKDHQSLPRSPFKHAALVVHGSTKVSGLFGQRSRIDIQLEVCVVKDKVSAYSPSSFNAVPITSSFAEERVMLGLSQKKAKREGEYEEKPAAAKRQKRPSQVVFQSKMTDVEKQQPVHQQHSKQISTPSSIFGAREWKRYLGEVGKEPPLPADVDEILEGSCPFWPQKKVRDTHLLVLIPTTVDGQPLTLDLLGKLIKSPKGRGNSTNYCYYENDVQSELGGQPSSRSRWVLMTRDVLPDSRNETYDSQKQLVADYAQRTGLAYEMPQALEAATAILLNYIRTGEHLYVEEAPLTFTRCQEKMDSGRYPVVVGGFSSAGLDIYCNDRVRCYYGVACLRRF